MGVGKFCLFGEDKKTLLKFKNTLVTGGSIYLRSTKETGNILRIVRGYTPDLVIIEVMNKFEELKPILEVIDEEILTACILILDSQTDKLMDFLSRSKVISYIFKPVSYNSVMQVTDLSIINYNRVLCYEKKIKELNETLESRKAIEKAKWILVEQEGLTEFEAYDTIRKKSRDNRLPMIKIAEAIILYKGLKRL